MKLLDALLKLSGADTVEIIDSDGDYVYSGQAKDSVAFLSNNHLGSRLDDADVYSDKKDGHKNTITI